jgi:hypothetical protein
MITSFSTVLGTVNVLMDGDDTNAYVWDEDPDLVKYCPD